MLTAKSIDKLVDDLAEVIEIVKGDLNGLNADKGDMVALYGVGQTSVGPIVVSKLAEAFLDTLYA
jgi:sphinganine-1-phosphate aldolase